MSIINGRGWIWIVLLGWAVWSCKSDSRAHQASFREQMARLEPDFKDFYRSFHADSTYQMQHIIWPLATIKSNLGQNDLHREDNFISRDEWVVQHDFDEKEAGYTRHLKVVTPQMVEESIVDETGKFGIVRRFAKMDGQWYLIFYSGFQAVR